MKLTRNGVLRINFRYSSIKENFLWKVLHFLKDRYPDLVRKAKRVGLKNYSQMRSALQCNFNCSYCLVRNLRRHAFSEKHFDQTRLIWDYLSRIEDQIMVRINFDGETLIDKWAMKCALYVNKIPNVNICELFTNNSLDPRSYLDKVIPEKTTFNCSFHSENISLDTFLRHIDILREGGCRVIVNVPVTPQVIKDLPVLSKKFKENNICFRPNLLIGYFDGRIFPHDYSPQELKDIKHYYYSEFEFEYALGRSPRGQDCYAGVDMLGIYLNGTVKRCGIINIGQIKDIAIGRVKLEQEAYACPHDDCLNYSHMMGLKEFRDKFIMSDEFVDDYRPKNG